MQSPNFYQHIPPLVLASTSPRRVQLLRDMGLSFEQIIPTFDERSICIPNSVLAETLAREKVRSAQSKYTNPSNKLFIAADTIVILKGKRLDKPTSSKQAQQFLTDLANHSHLVITGVAFRYNSYEHTFQVTTTVTFTSLTAKEIDFYISNFAPLDKAGAYGIQEWIGLIGISKIDGSYTNVMGLPTEVVHQFLRDFNPTGL